MKIGEKIRTIRKQKGIKQKDLASSIGLTVNGLQKIEYGKTIPKRITVHKIAKVLGVSDTDLDDNLREMLERFNQEHDPEALSKEVSVWESITETFGEEPASFFNDFLSLNPEGQQKASEYMEFLMQKHKK